MPNTQIYHSLTIRPHIQNFFTFHHSPFWLRGGKANLQSNSKEHLIPTENLTIAVTIDHNSIEINESNKDIDTKNKKTDDHVDNQTTNVANNDHKSMNHEEDEKKICVRRDKEEIFMDQELPFENFVNACEHGFCRVMTEDKMKLEYQQTLRVARSVSLQSNLPSNVNFITGYQHKHEHNSLSVVSQRVPMLNRDRSHSNHVDDNNRKKSVHLSLYDASLIISSQTKDNNTNENNTNENDHNLEYRHDENKNTSPSDKSCSSSWSNSNEDNDSQVDKEVNDNKQIQNNDIDNRNVNNKNSNTNEVRHRIKRFSSYPSHKTFRLMSPTRYNNHDKMVKSSQSSPSSPYH